MISFSDFSLLKEDSDSYSIGHPQGKSIRVPKKGLSDKAHAMIKKLVKQQGLDEGGQVKTLGEMIGYPGSKKKPKGYAEGGDVDAEEYDPKATKAFMSGLQQTGTIQGGTPGVMGATGETMQPPAMGVSGASEATGTPQPPVDPVPTPTPGIPASAEISQGPAEPVAQPKPEPSPYQTEIDSIREGIRAEGISGNEIAKLNEDMAKKQAVFAENSQKKYIDFQSRDAAHYNAMNTGEIDPDRYLNKMGTGSRITSAIAMILGGIGAGLTGGPNLAAKQFDDAIKQDIDSQKEDKSNKMNLWKMNREAFRSDQEADMATQNQLLNGAKFKIAASQSRAQGPMAQQRGAQLIFDVEQKMDANRQMMAALGASGDGASSPAAIQYLPEGQKELAVALPGGGFSLAATKKDADEMKGAFVTLSKIDQQLDGMESFMSKHGHGTEMYGTDARAEANSKQTSLKLLLKDFYKLGVLSETDHELLDDMVPNPGQWMQAQAKVQVKEIKKRVHEFMASDMAIRLPGARAPGRGLNKTSPRQSAIIAYARAHPEDPKSAIHLKKLGVE